jgi:small subunit ribosomal protein S16
MSVTIRLARIGRKNLPAFRVVVSNTKDKRNGRFLEILGHFNPSDKKSVFTYEKERFEFWKKNGALVSEAVQQLIDGKYKFEPYKKAVEVEEVKEAKETKETQEPELKEETPVEEAKTE